MKEREGRKEGEEIREGGTEKKTKKLSLKKENKKPLAII